MVKRKRLPGLERGPHPQGVEGRGRHQREVQTPSFSLGSISREAWVKISVLLALAGAFAATELLDKEEKVAESSSSDPVKRSTPIKEPAQPRSRERELSQDEKVDKKIREVERGFREFERMVMPFD